MDIKLWPCAQALRDAMRGVWKLPPEEKFVNIHPDWLLVLLSTVTMEERCSVLLLLWRTWQVRNILTDANGDSSIQSLVHFLESYHSSLFMIRQRFDKSDDKGKQVVVSDRTSARRTCSSSAVRHRWRPPGEGWVKLNVDGAFDNLAGAAGVGFVARDF